MWLPEVKPYSSLRACLVIYIASNVQGCQKKLAAGENRCLLVGINRLLCLAFLYRWCFLNKISLDWSLTFTTQPSTSKLSDNPECIFQGTLSNITV